MQRVPREQKDVKTTQLHKAAAHLHGPRFLPLKGGIPGFTFLPCTPRSPSSGKIGFFSDYNSDTQETGEEKTQKGKDVSGRVPEAQRAWLRAADDASLERLRQEDDSLEQLGLQSETISLKGMGKGNGRELRGWEEKADHHYVYIQG